MVRKLTTLADNATEEHRLTQEYSRFLVEVEQLLNSARELTGDSAALIRRKLEDRVAQAKVRLELARLKSAELASRPATRRLNVAYVAFGAALALGTLAASLWYRERGLAVEELRASTR